MTEEGFKKAQSDNLPRVDALKVASFFRNNDCFVGAEIRGSKAYSAGRESYGDNATGYVQLKRHSGKYIVKCKICPEHKVRSRSYSATLIVDEEHSCIDSVLCDNCAASAGGCKNAIAFLMWVHRRSEEKASTSVECYCKKSELSAVGTTKKYIKAKDMSSKKQKIEETTSIHSNSSFLNAVAAIGKEQKTENQLCRYFTEKDCVSNLSLHYLAIKFTKTGGGDCESFFKFVKENMSAEHIKLAERQTCQQNDDSLWHELRYMRITASKLYEETKCKTPDGTFVKRVIGAMKIKATKAMKRGCALEKKVITVLQTQIGSKIQQSGLLLSDSYPVMGASPDGIAKDFVVEVKCPISESTAQNYIIKCGKINDKFLIQIQMQMHFANINKGVFCVADPKFESTKAISVLWVDYDRELTYIN